VESLEQKILRRADGAITALAGYAGSLNTGPHHSACYHNADNFSDYGSLGHAEVIRLGLLPENLEDAFGTFFSSFIQVEEGHWDRPDFFNVGAEYRSVVGFPGGMTNELAMSALRQANVHNLSLLKGKGADPDTFGLNAVYVMDSNEYGFIQAEPCLQFHDDQTVKYPRSYHDIKGVLTKLGRIANTSCPATYVCGDNHALRGASRPAANAAVKPAWFGRGKGRTCPAWPQKATDCPLKNITDKYGEFEPVCILHFPQIGGEFAEYQSRRCMPGEKAPYFRDSQGVFRCACCGAPLFKPSQQFDQPPASNWPWPSFHSPPLDDSDGNPSVCHRGEPTPGVVNRNATIDFGLGTKGEVGCARCGAHLGDYFDSDDMGHDHYCINGVCMTPPGGAAGETCAPTIQVASVVV
jgi:peptide methionine sulfoxide reductase MsrB